MLQLDKWIAGVESLSQNRDLRHGRSSVKHDLSFSRAPLTSSASRSVWPMLCTRVASSGKLIAALVVARPKRAVTRIPTANGFPSLVMIPPLVKDFADSISWIASRQTHPTQRCKAETKLELISRKDAKKRELSFRPLRQAQRKLREKSFLDPSLSFGMTGECPSLGVLGT